MVKEAIHHQHKIGWGAAALEFLSNKWQLVQQQHFHKTGSKWSSKRVIAALIRKLWIEAGEAKTTQDMIASLQERICLHYNKGISGVSIHAHHLFNVPLNSILIKPARDQIAWLECVVASQLWNKCCLCSFEVANQAGIKLIDGLTAGGLLHNFLSVHKEPPLCTTNRWYERKAQLAINRDDLVGGTCFIIIQPNKQLPTYSLLQPGVID
eukprot:4590094-Ditylum_brightwellii.AAC.1